MNSFLKQYNPNGKFKEDGVLNYEDKVINYVAVDGEDKNNSDKLNKFSVEGFPTIILRVNDKVYNYEATPDKDSLNKFLQTSL